MPVELQCHWRLADDTENSDGRIRNISIGGAQLFTDSEIAIDSEIVVEIVAPGGAEAVSIAGKISYTIEGAYGVRFIYRDGGGSRRLHEIVRRLTSAH